MTEKEFIKKYKFQLFILMKMINKIDVGNEEYYNNVTMILKIGKQKLKKNKKLYSGIIQEIIDGHIKHLINISNRIKTLNILSLPDIHKSIYQDQKQIIKRLEELI